MNTRCLNSFFLRRINARYNRTKIPSLTFIDKFWTEKQLNLIDNRRELTNQFNISDRVLVDYFQTAILYSIFGGDRSRGISDFLITPNGCTITYTVDIMLGLAIFGYIDVRTFHRCISTQ